jgi:hypothetical protein
MASEEDELSEKEENEDDEDSIVTTEAIVRG